jgi:hypothetical protein
MPADDDARARPESDPAMAKLETLEERARQSSRLRLNSERYAYQLLTAGAALFLTLGTVVFRILEDRTWIDSFYFSAIAVTTVGFGDLAPTTDGAKLLSVLYVFSGVAIITSFLNVRLKRRARAFAATRSGSPSASSGPTTSSTD